MLDLTIPQKKVFKFIMRSIRFNQRPPTLKEICEHMEWVSDNAASEVLKTLEKKGYIEIKRGSRRSLKVVGYRLAWVKRGLTSNLTEIKHQQH